MTLFLAAGLAVAAGAPPRAESLAAAKKLLVSAKQDPALEGLGQKALQIAIDLERLSAELDRLKSLKTQKTDPVFKGLVAAVEADRVRLLALQAQAQPAAGSGQTKQSKGETKQSSEESQKSRDRRRAAMDAIQKLLDIIRGMNPQL